MMLYIDKHCLRLTDLTDRTIEQFLKRLASVIAAKGGHSEQYFD